MEDFGIGFYSGASQAQHIAEALIDVRNRAVADYIKALGIMHRPPAGESGSRDL